MTLTITAMEIVVVTITVMKTVTTVTAMKTVTTTGITVMKILIVTIRVMTMLIIVIIMKVLAPSQKLLTMNMKIIFRVHHPPLLLLLLVSHCSRMTMTRSLSKRNTIMTMKI